MKVACIVEGFGEVAAVPLLLRRLAEWRSPGRQLDVGVPIRVHRGRFFNRPDEFRRHLLLAAAKCGDAGRILVLVDADDDCPVTKAREILARARECVAHRPVAVVLANREYEAWFIAAAESLHGQRGFAYDATDLPSDPDVPRDAKGWMRRHMSGGTYGETTDQPAFTACMNLEVAHARSRSFRKLCNAWDELVGGGER